MFETLSHRLTSLFDRLRNRGTLTEEDVNASLGEIRQALLDADVALSTVQAIVEDSRAAAIGQAVIKSITPDQLMIKIIHDRLVALLTDETSTLSLKTQPPAVILLVGLQGSGKTTTTAKLAYYLTHTLKKHVLMASLDVYRPAAQEQLVALSNQLKLNALGCLATDAKPLSALQSPLDIASNALKMARQRAYDVVLLDTAGRLQTDEALMAELVAIKAATNPVEILLVADSLMGQEAVTIAQQFDERVGITGLILTRVDGDARGGAALSMRHVTGKPIKFIGVGEKPTQFEVFNANRLVSRLLGRGDIIGFVNKALEAAERDRTHTPSLPQRFTLDDMKKTLEETLSRGGIQAILDMVPGLQKIQESMPTADLTTVRLHRDLAILRSMTNRERKNLDAITGSRRRRIAAGAGVTVQAVNVLLKAYENMCHGLKRVNKLSLRDRLRHRNSNKPFKKR